METQSPYRTTPSNQPAILIEGGWEQRAVEILRGMVARQQPALVVLNECGGVDIIFVDLRRKAGRIQVG